MLLDGQRLIQVIERLLQLAGEPVERTKNIQLGDDRADVVAGTSLRQFLLLLGDGVFERWGLRNGSVAAETADKQITKPIVLRRFMACLSSTRRG